MASSKYSSVWFLSAFFLVGIVSSRGTPAELIPIMTEPGKVLVDDAFTAEQPPPGWDVSKKGHMDFGGGEIKGTEIMENHHPALVRHLLPVHDMIVAFSVRLGSAGAISLSIDDETAHVCRVLIDAKGFVLQRDQHGKDDPVKAAVLKRVTMPISANDWHRVLVEIHGAEIVAQIDDREHVAWASDPQIDRLKGNFGFTMTKGPGYIRAVKVWAAKPKADWEKVKVTLKD